jgi:thiol-disulfide isomerase/thioredoxin
MKNSTLLFGFLAISTLSGCVGEILNSPQNSNMPKKEVIRESKDNVNEEINRIDVTNSLKNPDIECNEQHTQEKTKSKCDRGLISEEELKKSKNRQGGIHTLKSIRGKTIHIIERKNGFIFPEYKDKIIILEFFGKDCPHCMQELPIIQKIRRKYRGKLEVIAIQSQDRMSLEEAQNYINGHNIRYPIIEGEDAIDLQHFVQKTYNWSGILPYTLVVKDGVTEFYYAGEFDYNEIKRDIDSIIN